MKENKWFTPEHAGFYRGGAPSVNWYNHRVLQRRERYPDWANKITEESSAIAEQVREKGHAKIENFWDKDLLDKLRSQTLQLMKEADPKKVKYPQDGRHTQINMPMFNTNYVKSLATDDRIVSIATAFLNCAPALGTTNLRLSKAEKSIAEGTGLFHRDFNSPVKLIKFFTYLNDVDESNGPLTFVEGSNRQMPSEPHWSTHHRWPTQQIEELYGKERIKHLTANYGDLLIATTIGFHRGLPLKTGQRLMLTLNYVIHSELGGEGIYSAPQAPHWVDAETHESYAGTGLQSLFDFMEITPK